MKTGKMHNKYDYWLAGITILPGRKKICLKRMFEETKMLYHTKSKTLEHISFMTDREREGFLAAQNKSEQELEREWEYCIKNQICLTLWQEQTFPKKLKNIYNPPYGLFYQGRLPDHRQPTVGVVGARNCSAYGKTVAKKIGEELAKSGIEVISGMAAGIDGAAQKGALDANGYTCGVLGCGTNICYPAANRELYQRLIEKGSVLSEYPPHTRPLAMYFPQRNRIISGLSDVVIVVEARERSGSLITADFALEQGREVYAVPGRICDVCSQGTNRLISQGAGIFLNMEDFLKEMHIFMKTEDNSAGKEKIVLENLERLVYSCLDLTPRNLETLMIETGLRLGALIENLEALQQMGIVSEIYKNYYIRSDTLEL